MNIKGFLKPSVMVFLGLVLVFLNTALGVFGMGTLIPTWLSGIGAIGVVAGGALIVFGKAKK